MVGSASGGMGLGGKLQTRERFGFLARRVCGEEMGSALELVLGWV